MDHWKNTTLRVWCLALSLVPGAAFVGAQEATVYGAGVTETDSVPLETLLDRPEEYVGKTVRVEGKITDVCAKMGCWIDIAGENPKRPVRFKVEDGVIEFPVECKGRSVVAQGVFTRIELTEAQALSWAQHEAEERGEEFDPETAKIATTIYRMEGTGAAVRQR